MNAINFFFILGSILIGQSVKAKEVRYLLRSPRALLMGDAYIALASDEFAIFYNPASLGKNKGFELSPLNPRLGVTNIYDDMDRFDNFPSDDSVAIANRVMDLPIYSELGVAPGLKMGGFGLSLFANSSSSIVLQNQVHPFLDVDYRYDRGFIMGYAHNLVDKQDERFSIGMSVKHINREGLDQSYSFFGPKLLNAIAASSSDMDAIRENLGYSTGSAWGGDLGVEYSMGDETGQFIVAASALDIFTHFKKESGNAEIPEQETMINLGTAWKQKFFLFDYSLSFDVHPVNQPVEFGRKIHVGMQVGLPVLRAYAGWNAGYLSYGLGVKFWPFEITGGLYGKEIGASFKQNEGKRAIVMISLLDIDFDL